MTEPRPARDLPSLMLTALFIGALLVAGVRILWPFLPSMVWAVTIVVATWPLMRRVEARLGGRRALAVGAMTAALLMVLVVPISLTGAAIVEHAGKLAGLAGSLATVSLPLPPDWVGRLPMIGGRLDAEWRSISVAGPQGLSAQLAPYAGAVLGWLVAQIGHVGLMIVQFLVTVVIAAILYARGETVADWVRRFARRLAGRRGEEVVHLAAVAARAVALGVVVTALIQALLSGIGLTVVGVPYAAALTAVMFILTVGQIGPLPVLVPAVVWLYWRGDFGWGTALLVWTVAIVATFNVLGPLLIRRGADLPTPLIFAGVIGGLAAFGIIGLFIGPVVLAVGYTLLAAWVEDGSR